MELLKNVLAFLFIVGSVIALPPATSYQSISSGEGWRYSYGIVHGPPGIGHAVGESYPHGYGGFGTYAPSYGHGGYGVSHLDLSTLLPHGDPVPVVPKPLEPVHGFYAPSYIKSLEPVHFLHEKPIAAVAPLPVLHEKPLLPLEHEHALISKPVITKPLSVPFKEYVLSSPLHYQYGLPHHGAPYYGVPHHAVPYYGVPHHGLTHHELPHHDLTHYSFPSYEHHDDDHHDIHFDSDIFNEHSASLYDGYKGLVNTYGSPYTYSYGHEYPSYHSLLSSYHHHH